MSSGIAFAAELVPMRDAHRVWAMSGFTVPDGPTSANPFDPDVLALDAVFAAPSGREIRLPAFWYVDYSREPKEGHGVATPVGEGGWRVRFTPVESGAHQYRLEVMADGKTSRIGTGGFAVEEAATGARGFVRVDGEGKRHFQTDDGQPPPLLGECCCWHGKQRGTCDSDDWFADCRPSGMNCTRL